MINVDKIIFEKLKSSTILNSYYYQTSKNNKTNSTSYYNYFNFLSTPENVISPYITWQIIFGGPENYLNDNVNVDKYTLQFDLWFQNRDLNLIQTILNELDTLLTGSGYITSWRGEQKESGTNLFRYSFDYDIYIDR